MSGTTINAQISMYLSNTGPDPSYQASIDFRAISTDCRAIIGPLAFRGWADYGPLLVLYGFSVVPTSP